MHDDCMLSLHGKVQPGILSNVFVLYNRKSHAGFSNKVYIFLNKDEKLIFNFR